MSSIPAIERVGNVAPASHREHPQTGEDTRGTNNHQTRRERRKSRRGPRDGTLPPGVSPHGQSGIIVDIFANSSAPNPFPRAMFHA